MGFSRREFLRGGAACGAMAACGGCRAPWGAPMAGRPSPEQLLWQEQELGMFFHFDIPVFKPGWKWRSFKDFPTPDLYNPEKMDTDQWMEAAKAMGAKYVVFVAKHCSGFLQWQSDLYPYGVRQSKWRDGKGDVVKMFTDSARKYGLKPGLYASVSANGWWGVDNPGLVNRGKGGDPEAQRRYAKVCEGMATELWSRYGDLFEIWFDGGALAPEKGGPDLMPILEKYQPHAILFQGPKRSRNLIRWIGNERGVAPYPCWSSTNMITQEGGDRESRFPGHPDGDLWAPGECDVPIRNHAWFWGENEGKWRYWTDEELLDKYYRSVGRNCNLLLNANPGPDGLVPARDVEQYRRFGDMVRRRFAHPLGAASGEGDVIELRFPAATEVDQVVLQENLRDGHRIRQYVVEGELAAGGVKLLCDGSCVGHKRIQTFDPVAVKSLRLRVTVSTDKPLVTNFAAFDSRS